MPRTIALIYLACGALWIVATGGLLSGLHLDEHRLLMWRTGTLWVLVFGSALLLFVLLSRTRRRNEEAMSSLLQTQMNVRRMSAELEERVAERTRQLETANRELESFAYAVSHDLRAPLRSLSGFSQILRESAPPGLDEKSQQHLQRIHDASVRMSSLIEDLLGLSRISRSELNIRAVNLSELCTQSAAALSARHPDRRVAIDIAADMNVMADARLLRIAVDNLLGNAWKYTIHTQAARITVGVEAGPQGSVYFVKDNGVGFDMAYADKLFTPFQRLHADAQFAGSGIGLVTTQRILARHGGRIWAESAPERGASFYFTLDAAAPARPTTP